MATGMLPLCFGQATKACGQLLGSAKAYRARLLLGSATDTGDADGQVVATAPVPPAAAPAPSSVGIDSPTSTMNAPEIRVATRCSPDDSGPSW